MSKTCSFQISVKLYFLPLAGGSLLDCNIQLGIIFGYLAARYYVCNKFKITDFKECKNRKGKQVKKIIMNHVYLYTLITRV